MKTILVRLKGTVPLIMHSDQAASPTNAYSKLIKTFSSKRKKTDADFQAMARIEWEAGLYVHAGKIVLPAENVEKCFIMGARKNKKGKDLEEAMFIEENFLTLLIDGSEVAFKVNGTIPNPELDKYYIPKHIYAKLVMVNRSKIERTRPIFYDWAADATVNYDENILNRSTLTEAIQTAGARIGLCERRPRFGRFEVEVLEG